eukprot:COSAG06_NODE_36401_length_447_cov_1.341954_1_plen_61_part_00
MVWSKHNKAEEVKVKSVLEVEELSGVPSIRLIVYYSNCVRDLNYRRCWRVQAAATTSLAL